MKTKMKFTIGIPTYNGASLIGETLESILYQSFQDFVIIICDDCSKDDTVKVIEKFRDRRIQVHCNRKNLGYGENLRGLRKMVKGDVLFLMGQDDILLKDALLKTCKAFLVGEDIGVVTRPYYWFDENVKKPVRALVPFDKERDAVISVFDSKRAVQKIFESVGQLSGLAYKVEYLNTDFHKETFPAHIYPFASITKRHKVVYLKDYTVAVRISSSQTRFKSSIYDISPTRSWVKMFNTVYRGQEYEGVRKAGIEQIAKNFVGLVQLKNYSTFRNLLREISILIKLRPVNLLNLRFWLFSLGSVIVPRKLLIPLVDNYKNRILSRTLGDINKQIREVQSKPESDKDLNHPYGKRYYEGQEFGFKSESRSDHKRILELLKPKPSDKVLEVGCGLGLLLSEIPSKQKVGIESNYFAVHECRKLGLTVVKADAEDKLPFNDDSFDIIILNEVLEHLKRPREALNESNRVLNRGGRILITTPARSIFVRDLAPTHFSEVTIRELRDLVTGCGFKVLSHEVRGVSFLYPLMERLMFVPFRFLRNVLAKRQSGKVKLVDSFHETGERLFLRPLNIYRKSFLGLGLSQLILAQKK